MAHTFRLQYSSGVAAGVLERCFCRFTVLGTDTSMSFSSAIFMASTNKLLKCASSARFNSNNSTRDRVCCAAFTRSTAGFCSAVLRGLRYCKSLCRTKLHKRKPNESKLRVRDAAVEMAL